MNTIHEGSIVRVTGRSGDWRVLPGEGLTPGTHERQLLVEALNECWVKRLTVPVSAVYLPILITLGTL
jgi:hypothetical protein